MKTTNHLRYSLPIFLLSLATVWQAQATPYASALTNASGTISFLLNESADDVRVISNGGATTNLLGALPAGTFSTNLGIASTFYVRVTKSSGLGYKFPSVTNAVFASALPISTSVATARYNSPRGLAVNTNAASPFFGRIYVANSTNGVTTGTGGRTLTGDGLYVINADFTDSPNGYGNAAVSGPFTFTPSLNSPYRITVGQDDYVYVADWADASGQLVRFDGDLKNPERVLDFVGGIQGGGRNTTGMLSPTNHGSIPVVVATGSLANGNLKLFTVDEDYRGPDTRATNSMWRYDIDGTGLTNQILPSYFASPGLAAGVNVDLERGPDGKFYFQQNRLVNDAACLIVLDENGTVLANSQTLTRTLTGNPTGLDFLMNTFSVAVSPDGKYVALGIGLGAIGTTNTASDTWIIPLTNGIPDFSQRLILDTGSVNQNREVAFDVAGNVYTLSSGDTILRAFSPGGFSIAVTGSDGTFDMPGTSVSLAVTDGSATETPGDPGEILITRTGDTSLPLSVGLAITGTASNGVDYAGIATDIVLPAGVASTNIAVQPIDDLLGEPTETALFALRASTNYTLASAGAVAVTIADNEPVINMFLMDDAMTESGDNGLLQISRGNDANGPVTVFLNISGTASNGVDYVTVGSVTLFAGGFTNVDLTAFDDALAEAPETIVIALAPGVDYMRETTNSVTAIISDNEFPQVQVEPLYGTVFERNATDVARFRVIRRGDLGVAITVFLAVTDVTTSPADYSVPFASVALNAGEQTNDTFVISPVNDTDLESNETFTVSIVPDAAYVVGSPSSALGTIIDDELAPEVTVLFADDFSTNSVPGTWQIRFGANNRIDDYSAEAGFDYGAIGLPAAPGSTNTLGLKLTVNKTNPAGGGGAGINLYPAGRSFSGNYAVRFNMYLLVAGALSTTEHATFGINHSGTKTNWARQSTTFTTNAPRDADGLWFALAADASSLNDYALFTGTNATAAPLLLTNRNAPALVGTFKSPPFYAGGTGIGGSPANAEGTGTPTWVDVEIRQVDGVVKLILDGTTIHTYTNQTAYTSGDVMLGYNDQFDSVGSPNSAVFYDNFRVISLGPPATPVITSVSLTGTTVDIRFTGGSGDEAANFVGQSTADIAAPFANDGSLTVQKLGTGSFRATGTISGNARFYRIRR